MVLEDNTYEPRNVDNYNDMRLALKSAQDEVSTGFDDLKTVERRSIIDLQSTFGTSRLRDNVTTTGSGSVPESPDSDTGELILTTGTTSGSSARLDSVKTGRYTAGYSAECGIGVRPISQPSGDAEMRWGYFDGDGFGWGYDSTGLFVFRQTNDTIVDKVYQSDWNGVDIDEELERNWNPTEGAIFQIEFAWYGYGEVEFQLVAQDRQENQITMNVHSFNIAGKTSIPDPNQPIAVLVDNGTTTDDVELRVGGRQFSIIGPYTSNYRITSMTRNAGVSVGSGTWTYLISTRRKTGFDYISQSIEGISAIINGRTEFAIIFDPDLTGTTYGPIDLVPTDETGLEVDKAGSFADITAGYKVWSTVTSGQSGGNAQAINLSRSDLDLELPDNVPIVLAARGLGEAVTVNGANLKLREDW